jgi:hypothetical protein
MVTLAFGIVAAFGQAAPTELPGRISQPSPSALEQKLREVRFDLRIENGRYTGAAAPVLEDAVDRAQYVLIGEDHITREIPQFTATMCDEMARHGLSAVAVETGPQVAKFVSSLFGTPDRLARMAALTHHYPDSVAFLNIQEENDLVEHCSEVASRSNFHLWGLDQEFLGSAGWLLDQILATPLGPASRAAITHLKDEVQRDAAQAKETGDPSNLFLLSASDRALNDVAALLQREGSPAANALFDELVESHEIYLKNAQRSPESNSQRARLLKQNFSRDLQAAGDPRHQRVLLKFGDWHLYKGFNPLNQRDLGNYVAELADSQGSISLHICILGAKGMHRMYAGYGRPTKVERFVLDEDRDYRWLKPAIDNQLPNAWTLFDLRKMRFQALSAVDPDMERLIYGYDLLIIIPEVTPADLIR